MSEGHVHKWISVMHMDGCHFYSNSYKCECGAVRSIHGERDFKKDPWAGVWALDTCDRCNALLDKARRKPRTDYVMLTPDGKWQQAWRVLPRT